MGNGAVLWHKEGSMRKGYDANKDDDCGYCDVCRYVDFVKTYGIDTAQRMQKEIEKNKSKTKKRLDKR